LNESMSGSMPEAQLCRQAPFKVPKLLKTYLAIGARIAAPPAWDREFGTIDFLTLLDLKLLSSSGAQPLPGPADALSLRAARRAVALGADATTEQIAERLRGPVPVLFFPEGTSTDGREVLRFHSRFFIPGVEAGLPVTAAAVRYVPTDGSSESSLCWFGDTDFLPHLLRNLGGPDFEAEIQFGEARVYENRRVAAQQTHDEVEAMRGAGVPVA
jgi:1-acyl-sn-glycerol-3-phosphate acyltransferase